MIDALETVHGRVNSALPVLAGRVYASLREAPEGWKPEDGGCIVFSGRGGGGHGESNTMLSVSLQFKCYGGGVHQLAQKVSARAIYKLLHEAIVHKPTYKIMGCQAEGTGIDLEEPESGLPFVLGFFRFQLRNTGD